MKATKQEHCEELGVDAGESTRQRCSSFGCNMAYSGSDSVGLATYFLKTSSAALVARRDPPCQRLGKNMFFHDDKMR